MSLALGLRSIAAGIRHRALHTSSTSHGLQELFEVPLKEGDTRTAGRSWTAAELRNKSWDDLHKLWYVLLKERLVLHAERADCRAKRTRMPAASRYPKVRKAMCNIKMVMTERAIALEDKDMSTRLRLLINAL